MKVKVGRNTYSAKDHPIMVILTNDDKFNITCMIESATKYAEFSDDWGDEKEMLEWMGTEAYRRIIA